MMGESGPFGSALIEAFIEDVSTCESNKTETQSCQRSRIILYKRRTCENKGMKKYALREPGQFPRLSLPIPHSQRAQPHKDRDGL